MSKNSSFGPFALAYSCLAIFLQPPRQSVRKFGDTIIGVSPSSVIFVHPDRFKFSIREQRCRNAASPVLVILGISQNCMSVKSRQCLLRTSSDSSVTSIFRASLNLSKFLQLLATCLIPASVKSSQKDKSKLFNLFRLRPPKNASKL